MKYTEMAKSAGVTDFINDIFNSNISEGQVGGAAFGGLGGYALARLFDLNRKRAMGVAAIGSGLGYTAASAYDGLQDGMAFHADALHDRHNRTDARTKLLYEDLWRLHDAIKDK